MLDLALVQFAPVFGEVTANLDRASALLEGVEADVVILPELFSSGYWFESAEQLDAVAEDLDGPTTGRMREWAKELGAAVAGGFAERSGNRFYNSAALVLPDGQLLHYRKLHLFAEEKRWFTPGDLPLGIMEFRDARLGLMICFDWRFPEAARTLAFNGADLILHPSNLVLPWCPDAMITRALENNVFIATADRCGEDRHAEDALRFIGRSQVIAPDGERLGQLPEDGDGVLRICIDPVRARRKSINEFNDLFGDLRTGFYRAGPAD